MTRAAPQQAKKHAALPASIEDRVRRELPDLSQAESRVAHALLGEYPLAGLETVARLASRAGTSGPTILRFVARLGFANYAEFQNALRGEIQTRLQGPLARYSAMPRGKTSGILEDVSLALQHNIAGATSNIGGEEFERIVDCVCDPGRNILLLGGRFSWMIASYLHHYLRELRSGSRVVRDSSAAWTDYLLDLRRGDLVIIFDFRRYQKDVLKFARGAHAQGADILLITDIWYSPIAAFATFVIACPVSIPSAFDSGVTGLAVVELIVAGVVERLGDEAKERIGGLESLRNAFRLGN